MSADVIDTLAGIAAGSPLDTIRRSRRPTAREHAQKSYDSLFGPADYGAFGPLERFAVAVFVAGLHGQDAIKAFYAEKAGNTAAIDAETAAAECAAAVAEVDDRVRRHAALTEHVAELSQLRLAAGPRLVAAQTAANNIEELSRHAREATLVAEAATATSAAATTATARPASGSGVTILHRMPAA